MLHSSIRRILFLALISALLLAPSFAWAGSKRLLAYYPSWAQTNTPSYSAVNIPYQKLTHIAHAFLLLNEKKIGKVVVPGELVEPLLISKAHAAGVKVIISVGGGDPAQAKAFSKIAASAVTRAAFVRNLHSFVVAHGYDGVDIDWEVPVAPHDTSHCIMLMQDLRNRFPAPRWLLSMAIPSDPSSFGSGFNVPALAPSLDFINVMTYDFHGPWTDHAGHNSPIFLDPSDPGQEGSLANSMDLFETTYGVPAEKLNIGTAFYGYEFDGAQNLWNYCTNCDTTTFSQNYGTYIKQRINKMGWTAYRDSVAKVPYLLNGGIGGQSGFITYDDATSTAAKVNYALGKRGFGGVFMWSLDADFDGKNQDLLNAMYKAFQRY
jgi:chitinase